VSAGASGSYLAPELETAADVIGEAASIARRSQDELLEVALKSGPADLVSQVDRQLDMLIVSRLLAEFPSDGSRSEENGRRAGTSGRTWVVDPIDGTHNYVAGLPYWGITIALMAGSRTLLGLVYDATDGTVHAAVAAGEGAEPAVPAGSPPPVSRRGPLAGPSSLVAVSLPVEAVFAEAGLRPPLDRIGDVRITGSISLDLAWTAAGRFDACAYRHRDNPWDWAAGELIARSRGRVVVQARWPGYEIVIAGRPEVAAVLTRA
jgi:myo-inositol-1(or 4)-monophosphatase